MTPFGKHPDHARVLRKLTLTTELSAEELEALRDTPVAIRHIEADEDIVPQGAKPSNCTAVLSGFACRYKLGVDGRRQILSFHAPGDMPDIQSLHVEVMDHGLMALRPTTVALLPHARLIALMIAQPKIEHALWREVVLDAATYRQWIFGLGRRTAEERLAHLICETAARFELIGMPDQAAAVPLRQTQLADALGLSTVHVNRVLQELRARSLLGPRRNAIEVLQPEALRAFADFDAAYLTLQGVSPHRSGRPN